MRFKLRACLGSRVVSRDRERPSDVIIWQKSLDVKAVQIRNWVKVFCISCFIFVSWMQCAKTLPAVHARFTFMETKAEKLSRKSQLGHTFQKDQSVHWIKPARHNNYTVSMTLKKKCNLENHDNKPCFYYLPAVIISLFFQPPLVLEHNRIQKGLFTEWIIVKIRNN